MVILKILMFQFGKVMSQDLGRVKKIMKFRKSCKIENAKSCGKLREIEKVAEMAKVAVPQLPQLNSALASAPMSLNGTI